ncbi:MAG: UvrD-helicase domain-containing protein, partial [Deltaproteobacteria bacterium]|nr:UvrD-helicase domain-containing protein [Deltaproteobacteria bacterium]
NLFDTPTAYEPMIQAMSGGPGFLGTIEFFPEEGKYHLDGHRKCGVRLEPAETRAHDGACPVCGRALTVGVLHRVEELADRTTPRLSREFFSLIPLTEILAELLECGPGTKKVRGLYEELLRELGPELGILMETPLEDVQRAGGSLLAEALSRMRRDRVIREGGYDGEYGTIRLFEETEKATLLGQLGLFGDKPPSRTSKRSPSRARHKGSLKGAAPKEPSPGAEAEDHFDPILDPLNPEQREAVVSSRGHLLIVAGPGTGKTLTLTHRVAWLIREGRAQARQVLAVTFTRKASREMEERMQSLLPRRDARQVLVATFHRFCLDVLKESAGLTGLPDPLTLCSEVDRRHLAREAWEESGGSARALGRFLDRLDHLKASNLSGSRPGPAEEDFLSAFEAYQERLKTLGMVDLSDLEVETLRLFQEHPEVAAARAQRHPWVFVDEYQDTNRIQADILKEMARGGEVSICAIGDPDQAIYGFRGADVGNFHRFEKEFPGARRVVLTRNYRSTQTICDAAAAVMGSPRPLDAQSHTSAPLLFSACRTEAEEAEMIVEQVEKRIGGTTYFSLDSGRVESHEGDRDLGFGDLAVLFRLNAMGDALEEAFHRAGIPVARSGEKPLIHRFPADILWRFFQVLQSPENSYYRERYRAVAAARGIREVTDFGAFQMTLSPHEALETALEHHRISPETEEARRVLDRLRELTAGAGPDLGAFLESLCLDRGIDHTALPGDRVTLMSLHAAKGLEWPVVFIVGCEEGLLPLTLYGEAMEAEERRLFYVGITRARHTVVFSHAARRALNGRVLRADPSPYLSHIPQTLMEPLGRSGPRHAGRAHKQLTLF